MHLHLITLGLLVIAGLFAGIVDTMAGGGGLISLPALLSAGLPPTLALGTNKLQGCVGEISASLHFILRKKIDLKSLPYPLIFTTLFAIIGGISIQLLHPKLLEKGIPFLLLGVLIYTLLAPKPTETPKKPRCSWQKFGLVFGTLIGFYNGFFGPPTGSLWMFALMAFMGMNIVTATMHAKPLNAIGNLTSLIPFIFLGNVDYLAGLAMIIGQLVGTRIGATLVIHKGQAFLKPFYISVVSIMMIDLFSKTYF